MRVFELLVAMMQAAPPEKKANGRWRLNELGYEAIREAADSRGYAYWEDGNYLFGHPYTVDEEADFIEFDCG
jgi:HK97 family phage major capsid protein